MKELEKGEQLAKWVVANLSLENDDIKTSPEKKYGGKTNGSKKNYWFEKKVPEMSVQGVRITTVNYRKCCWDLSTIKILIDLFPFVY